jgi:hypothetical protein
VLFFVPKGVIFSINPSFNKKPNLFVRILVAIFSFEDLNSLNLDFLCKIISLKIRSDHLSPIRLTDRAIAQVYLEDEFTIYGIIVFVVLKRSQ